MGLKPGLSALVTGGASGIGKAVALALSEKGLFVTIVDFSEQRGNQLLHLLEKNIQKFYPDLRHAPAMFIKCDVTNEVKISAAFEKHVEMYKGLDVCINCAGISSHAPFHAIVTAGVNSWKPVLDVNLNAVINCTALAIEAMQASKKPGVIINFASAAGLYPMYADAIYCASKAGVVMFTRSLASYKRQGIRINVICPEFIQTEMGSKVDRRIVDRVGGFLPMEMVIAGVFELINDESKAGSCLWISNRRGIEYWPTPIEQRKYSVNQLKPNSKIELPQSFEKVVVHTISHKFRSATKIIRVPLSLQLKPDHVLVKILYVGVNASDVNFSSGRYFSGNDKEIASKLPFDIGFEAVGLIASVGDSLHHLKVGSSVAFMAYGSYSEFLMVPSKNIICIAKPEPEVVAMLTSGLTASISLERSGRMGSGELVLVTAAAGGTGQFAVQLSKLAGNKVIATCGGEEKAALLKSLGADRVIDYRKENVKEVLKKEYPKGIDVIYESVGGDMFNLCIDALAIYGHLIIIGMISQYQGERGWMPLNYNGLCEKLLAKSQTVAGFFLIQYAHLWKQHLDKLINLVSEGKLKVALDPRKFIGVGSVADAVEYLHSGKSIGKVIVCMDPTFSQPSSLL